MEMLAESCWSPACIHHSTSLHFPLSSLCLICLLEFLSAQLFKKKINKSSPYFTSLSPSALLSFVFLPIRLPSSYFPLLLSFFFLDYHLSFCILSCSPLRFFFFPLPWLVCFCLPFVCPCCPSRKSLAVSCLHWSVSLGS